MWHTRFLGFLGLALTLAAGCNGGATTGADGGRDAGPRSTMTPAAQLCDRVASTIAACGASASPCEISLVSDCESVTGILSEPFLEAGVACLESAGASVGECLVSAAGALEPASSHRSFARTFCAECALGLPQCEPALLGEGPPASPEIDAARRLVFALGDDVVARLESECAHGIGCAAMLPSCAQRVLLAEAIPEEAVRCLVETLAGGGGEGCGPMTGEGDGGVPGGDGDAGMGPRDAGPGTHPEPDAGTPPTDPIVYRLEPGVRYTSPAHGGGGGEPFAATCGVNEVMTGMQGRAGFNLDAAGAICSELRFDGTLGPARATTIGGGGGGEPFAVTCPSGQVVVEIRGRSQLTVHRIGLVCATLDAWIDLGAIGAVLPEFGGEWGGAFGEECPRGYVSTGLRLRTGADVDQVAIECTRVARSS